MPTKPLRMLVAVAAGLSLTWMHAAPTLAQDEAPADPPAQETPAQQTPPAEAPAEGQAGVTASERVFNLENPCGVAIHPKTGQVFVSSTVAIYRYLPDEADPSKKINI